MVASRPLQDGYRMNCYLLIGGDSRRMGTPKASLVLRGEPFLERVAHAAERAFERVIAVQRHGRKESAVVETIVEPLRKHEGVAAAILTALEHAGGERVWIVGVDFPLVSPGILQFLRKWFEEAPAADILVPEWSGEPQYLCAGYDWRSVPAFQAAIEKGELSLRKIAARVHTEFVPEGLLRSRFSGEPLRNVNTPSEYDELVKRDETADTR